MQSSFRKQELQNTGTPNKFRTAFFSLCTSYYNIHTSTETLSSPGSEQSLMSHTNNILNFHQNSGSNEETYTMMLSSWTEPKRQGEDPRGPRRNGNTKGRERKRKTKWGKKEKRKQDRSMIFWGQCGLWKAPDSGQRRSPWNSHSKGRHTKQKSSFVY